MQRWFRGGASTLAFLVVLLIPVEIIGNPLTLIHTNDLHSHLTVSREQAGELLLLGALGYDAVTLGNHEFDLKPNGLASILKAAVARGTIPAVVAANVAFDSQDPEDDALEAAFQEIDVRPYRIFDRVRLKVGIFALSGIGFTVAKKPLLNLYFLII